MGDVVVGIGSVDYGYWATYHNLAKVMTGGQFLSYGTTTHLGYWSVKVGMIPQVGRRMTVLFWKDILHDVDGYMVHHVMFMEYGIYMYIMLWSCMFEIS